MRTDRTGVLVVVGLADQSGIVAGVRVCLSRVLYILWTAQEATLGSNV